MSKTISGHLAIKDWGSALLRSARVPIKSAKITLRTRKACLPLFLNVAQQLHRRVHPLSPRDTWSFNYRKPAMGSGISDHSGYAIDCWSSSIGAHTWPSRMSREQARNMAKVLSEYRTKDGRYVFGWGISSQAPGGDIYRGPTYNSKTANDPMHVYIARGITMRDVMKVRRRMKIKRNGEFKNR